MVVLIAVLVAALVGAAAMAGLALTGAQHGAAAIPSEGSPRPSGSASPTIRPHPSASASPSPTSGGHGY